MVQFEYGGETQNGEVLEVKANGDRTLKLEDGSIVSIARRNWKPLQQVAKLEPESSDDAAEESEEPIAKPKKKLPVDTWMKVGLVIAFAAIISTE